MKKPKANKPRARNKGVIPPDVQKLARDSSLSEKDLERIESDPGFQCMMEEGERAIREGRTVSHAEVLRRIKRPRKKPSASETNVVEHWRERAFSRAAQ